MFNYLFLQKEKSAALVIEIFSFTFNDIMKMEKIFVIHIIIINCVEYGIFPEQPLISPENEGES